ncbi:hypothetical protein PUN28_015292 [Cardiocondyla obscurior]|uniref:Ribosomal protein S3 n=1 Tax=Cardiocondyla obscurior TaxID=286306 RepID=A0AAW2EW09_9HYME
MNVSTNAVFTRVWRFGDERFATELNRPETRESRRSLSDHSWCKRKILDLPSTPDSTNTLQSEFRFGALGTKGSRRKLTKKTVRRPGKAAEVSLTIPGAREKSSTYPVLQIALTLCRVNSGLALWGRKVRDANQGNRPETGRETQSLSDHSWCKRKILDLPSTPDSTNTLQSEFSFNLKILLLYLQVWRFGDERFATKLTKETVRRPGKPRSLSDHSWCKRKSSTYPVLQIALTLCRVNSGLALWGRKVRDETNQGNRPDPGSRRSLSDHSWCKRKSSTYPVLQIALTLCRVWRFGDERFATETNQGNRPETWGSRRSLSDHSWCKRKILDLPSTPDSTNTLQSEFRFGALGTKGSRRKLTKKPSGDQETAEVPLTIPGARENSSTYPVLQIALTLCRVWRFGDERFATETNQGNRPETRKAAEVSLTIPGARKILDLPSTPDSTNTLQSEFRFGALGTKGSRRKLTKETVRRPGEAAEVSLTIPGARENSSTYPVLQIALTLCRVNSGLALWGRKVWRFGDERFATETNQGNRPKTRENRRSLTIPGARENSSTYPVLQIALTLCRVNSGLALWGRKVRDETNQRKPSGDREAAEVPLTIPGAEKNPRLT